MLGRPEPTEAAPYYFTYINQVESDNALAVIERQLEDVLSLCAGISEEKSLHRYAPDKWSIRPEAWLRTGIASNNQFSVRAMAFITAGHVTHHVKILQERYL